MPVIDLGVDPPVFVTLLGSGAEIASGAVRPSPVELEIGPVRLRLSREAAIALIGKVADKYGFDVETLTLIQGGKA